MSGDTTVTKTQGKKAVGGINRMVMDTQYFGKKLEKEAKVIDFTRHIDTNRSTND